MTQINKTKNDKGEVTTDTTKIQRIVRDYKATICQKKKRQPGRMGKFLERYTFQD